MKNIIKCKCRFWDSPKSTTFVLPRDRSYVENYYRKKALLGTKTNKNLQKILANLYFCDRIGNEK